MKLIAIFLALVILNITCFSQSITAISFTRNNGNGTCGGQGELRVKFSPACPTTPPIIDSVYIDGVKSNVTFNAPNMSHCGANNGYLSFCVTSGNMPPANVWTIYFHDVEGSSYQNTIFNGNGGPLSVKYHSFFATLAGKEITCSWITEEEINNNRFELERSIDGRSFNLAAIIFSSEYNKDLRHSYKYIDNYSSILTNQKMLYYRLKQIDNDGKYSYSNIITVKIQTENSSTVSSYPNPIENILNIKVNSAEKGVCTIRISNLKGQMLVVKEQKITNGFNNISFSNLDKLSKGIYVAEVFINGKVTGNQKVIKK